MRLKHMMEFTVFQNYLLWTLIALGRVGRRHQKLTHVVHIICILTQKLIFGVHINFIEKWPLVAFLLLNQQDRLVVLFNVHVTLCFLQVYLWTVDGLFEHFLFLLALYLRSRSIEVLGLQVVVLVMGAYVFAELQRVWRLISRVMIKLSNRLVVRV